MTQLAIIGGSGLTSLKNLEVTRREVVYTPYGEPSGPLTHGRLCGKEMVFLPRHGYGHTIPPHLINYRANLQALQQIGVKQLIAIAAVGSIRADVLPGSIVIPDQIVDYTWGRAHTFFEGGDMPVTHIDFTRPYSAELRALLMRGCAGAGLTCNGLATYGATQGPRLETAAEINRLERDGCDIVGMTGMPEAGLAAELGLAYASCAVVANMAAGRGEASISMAEIEHTLKQAMEKVRTLLAHVIPLT
jgi:5'-deoxy-5'-methylthioadenosine phosphorylase